MTEYLQLLIYGLVLGSQIALGAIGVSLTFGVLRFANFAHGDLMTVGAYGALTGIVIGLPLYLAFLLGMLLAALVAWGSDALLYRRFRRAGPLILLISSFGVGLILRSLVQLIWGPETQVYQQGIQFPIRVFDLRIKPDHITIGVGSLLLVVGVHLLLQYTRLGKAMRAMADNPDLARLCGISTERVIAATWIIGGALAAAAGCFLALDTRLQPDMGWFFLLPVFAAAILGGIGRPYGAILGGYFIGIAQEFSTLIIASAYKPAVAFGLMVLVLIIRPTGIFAGKS